MSQRLSYSWKKIQTLRELEATEAKLDVIDKHSRCSEFDDLKRSLPDVDIVDKFMRQVTPEAKLDTFNDKLDNIENSDYDAQK